MKYFFKLSAKKTSIVFGMATLIFLGCTKSSDFSSGYDINWPVPTITSIAPVKDTIGKIITITGTNFDKLSSVTVGTPATQVTVISSNSTSIVVGIPRTVSAGPVTVTTNYKQTVTSAQVFTPVYLNVTATAWPAKIIRGQAFIITGINMDMVTEVEVDGHKMTINPAPGAATNQISVSTQGLTLGTPIVVKITKAKAGIINGTSGPIPVEDPSTFFTPVAPVVIYDFENSVNPFTLYSGVTATSGLNASGAIKGRDAKYLSVQMASAANWAGIGEANYTTPISLATFHKPCFTFLANTEGKDGYMQVQFTQGGTKWGLHFKASNSPYDYNLKNNGWTWVSVELTTANLENWGGSATAFDPTGTIDAVQLGFKRGNGTGTTAPYEINIDQVMITDGPQKPVINAFDFENGANPYSGSATSGINQSGIATKSGNNYLTVKLPGAANWNWTGDMSKTGPLDLSTIANAYLNFWINTNGNKGFFQIETTQASVKWGADLDHTNYLVQTTGWQLISLRMADMDWSKWGGTGTATTFDAKGVLDYLKIGFSTGNVAGTYEVNIDDVYISDGPMF